MADKSTKILAPVQQLDALGPSHRPAAFGFTHTRMGKLGHGTDLAIKVRARPKWTRAKVLLECSSDFL